jgi:hypothetical protein
MLDPGAMETAAVADMNRDGRLDIVSGESWYEAPTWKKHAFRSIGFANGYVDVFSDLPLDVNADGRIDVVSVSWFAKKIWWNENPGADATGAWREHVVTTHSPVEFAFLVDLDNDGVARELLPQFGDAKAPLTWYALRNGRFEPRQVSDRSFGHGIGAGDVNGDGRNDIVTSLQAHGLGLAWFEQRRAADGTISFTRHMIMDDFATANAGGVTFSELHGSAVADVDGDGLPDFVVGKRAWAHLDSYYDPDPYGPAVLYVYRTVRDRRAPGGARFEPELVHNRSGVGSNVVAQDVDGDGAVDIVTATNRGTFVFHGTARGRRPSARR